MSIAIGEDHQLLGDAVARFAAERCTPAAARDAVEGDERLPPFWSELVRLGWMGLDATHGYGLRELVIVLEANID